MSDISQVSQFEIPRASVNRGSSNDAPLTFTQQQIWLAQGLESGTTPEHLSALIWLRGPLDAKALGASWRQVVHRHDSLRTYFVESAEGVVSRVAQPAAVHLSLIDLSGEPEPAALQEARYIAVDQAAQPFDLGRGPLFHATLIRIQPRRHALALTLHRLISDEASIENLQSELGAFYEALSTNVESPLSPLPLQLADFARLERKNLLDGKLAASIDYWPAALSDAPSGLELPTDHIRTARRSFRGARQPIEIPTAVVGKIDALARAEGATLSEAFSACLETLLFRYTGQGEFLFAGSAMRRELPGTEALIGPLVSTVPMRADFSGEPSFRELLVRIRDRNRRDRPNYGAPWGSVAAPVAPILFSFQESKSSRQSAGNIWLETELISSGISRHDLSFHLFSKPKGIHGYVEYSTDLFELETVQRFIGHYRQLLNAALADPDGPVSSLRMLTPEEELRIKGWSLPAPVSGGPAPAMYQRFEEHAANSPHAIALDLGHEQVTYADLNIRANHVAHQIIAEGVQPGALVALAFRHSAELIVALLGTLKSGAAFVPLDPEWPPARLQAVLTDAAPHAILTDSQFASRFTAGNKRVLVVATETPESTSNPGISVQPDDLAYVIYTSGSTGTPKGALLKHRGWANLSKFQIEYFSLTAGDRVLQLSSPVFDALVFESGLALGSGATLCILGPNVPLAGPDLERAINRFGITAIALAPTTLAWFNPARLPSLKVIVSAGESLRPEIAELWRNQVRLLNGYGPTETTVCATLQPVERAYTGSVPIGRPIAGVQVELLDPYGNFVPVGVPGELWIGGEGVGAGYLNRPDLTERFFRNGKYYSGDRARWLSDGSLEFQGRKDHQVKIRGFRIELGEVEAVLNRHPAVSECAVVVEEQLQRISAYVVAAAAVETELRDYLRRELPAYMVPAQLVSLDRLPRNASGKIDLAALHFPATETGAANSGGVRQVWQEVLRIPIIRPGESFFDIGGHSLLAVDLLQRIEERFGKRISLADMVANPTLEYMEQTVESLSSKPALPELWPVQPMGAQPPFFFAHGDFSFGGFYCYELAEHLGDDQPLYAFPQHGPDGRAVPSTIEGMALDHLQVLRQFQPHGPYRLGGLCNGGLVAYEVARQLVLSGEIVESLIMIASVPRNLRLSGFNHEGSGEYIREAYRLAMIGYHPQPYSGPVDLVWPSQERRPAGFEDDSAIGWRSCVPDLRVHTVPGTHLTCMIDFMDETAVVIRECLASRQ